MASVSQKLVLLALAIAAQDTFTLAEYKDAQASDVDGTCVGKECLLRTDAQDGEVLLQSGLRARLGSREATHNGILEPSLMQTKKKIPSSSKDSTYGVDATLTVECKVIIREEGGYPESTKESDGLQYGMCTTDAGVVYYLEDDDTTEILPFGDMLSLQLVESTSTADGPWTARGKKLYKVDEFSAPVVMSAQEVAAKRRAQHGLNKSGTRGPKILVLLLKYSDKENLGYDMDATIAMNDLFALPSDDGYRGSFADMINRSSYGRLIFDKSSSKVLTVEMGTPWADEQGCDADSIASAAFEQTTKQHGVDPGDYDFREMFIPHSPGNGCEAWCGIANVGCGHPSLLPRPGGCNAWYRCGGPFVRSHELGHNLGLLHASGMDLSGQYVEYGDPQASMGGSYRMSSFIAAAREQMGFLHVTQGEVIEWKSWYDDPVTIGSISLPLNQPGAGFVAVKWQCPECIPKVESHKNNVGGYLWLQFRGDEGYSSLQLDDKYQNKVYVHLYRRYVNKVIGGGSELWAILDVHNQSSFTTLNSPFSVQLCSITGDVAKVSLGKTLQEAQSRCKKAASDDIPEENIQDWCYVDGGVTAGYADDGLVYTTWSEAEKDCNERVTCAGYVKTSHDSAWRLLMSDSYESRYYFAKHQPSKWQVEVKVKNPGPCTMAHSCTTGETTSCETCKVEHERTVENHCDTCNPGYALSGTSCEACTLWTYLPGQYLEGGFVTPGFKDDCFDEEEAKYECFNTYANNCSGITKQQNECGGQKWTLRVGPTAAPFFNWGEAQLKSYLLDRRCEATCEVYKCQQIGWVKKNSAKNEFELNDETCCKDTSIRIPFSEMTASQSAVAYGGEADKCLTDDVHPTWPGSCTFTGNTDPAWWNVSLTRSVNVQTVSLTNRADCCSERLQNVDIFVGGQLCASTGGELKGGQTKNYTCEGYGSEVSVQHTGSVGLTICGFKLFESGGGGEVDTVWTVHREDYCWKTWGDDWKKRVSPKTVSECKSLCIKDSNCKAITHGDYGGETDICVQCTSPGDLGRGGWTTTYVKQVTL